MQAIATSRKAARRRTITKDQRSSARKARAAGPTKDPSARPALPRVRDRRLRRRHPGDRDAERRAGHVVEPVAVEELDRVGVAPVLAADAELELRLGLL